LKKLIFLAVIAVLSLTGCATTSGNVNDESVSGTNAPEEEATEARDEKTEAVTAEEPPASTNPKFGETFTYEDGLSVTVGAPEPYTPSEYAAKGNEPSFLRFQITVVNGTAENYDPALFYVTMQSGNVESQEVYDSENGINGSPTTAILPGREGTWPVVFGVMDPADLVMQVKPDLGISMEPVIFTF